MNIPTTPIARVIGDEELPARLGKLRPGRGDLLCFSGDVANARRRMLAGVFEGRNGGRTLSARASAVRSEARDVSPRLTGIQRAMRKAQADTGELRDDFRKIPAEAAEVKSGLRQAPEGISDVKNGARKVPAGVSDVESGSRKNCDKAARMAKTGQTFHPKGPFAQKSVIQKRTHKKSTAKPS